MTPRRAAQGGGGRGEGGKEVTRGGAQVFIHTVYTRLLGFKNLRPGEEGGRSTEREREREM